MKNYSRNFPAALMVFSISIAIVIEQTPPDKGV